VISALILLFAELSRGCSVPPDSHFKQQSR